MQRFRSPSALQRFVTIFSAVRNLFVPAPSKHSAIDVHLHRLRAIAHWKGVAGIAA
ncbi:putative transposase [Rhizobium leguminosarum]|nr:putative transposase [Rhizobium leguminosarum]